MQIMAMTAADWPDVRAIYQEGIQGGQATFETTLPSWSEWDAAKRADCRLVARREDIIMGWAALSPVSKRAVYAGVAEVSVYVARSEQGQGIGRRLLLALIEAADAAGVWTLQATVFPENEASVALHHACGFRTVGYRERIAQHYGRWRNVLLLERRSNTAGMAI